MSIIPVHYCTRDTINRISRYNTFNAIPLIRVDNVYKPKKNEQTPFLFPLDRFCIPNLFLLLLSPHTKIK